MVDDTQKSIITHIYDLLMANPGLETALGGPPRLAFVWAPPDCVFPYLVHRLDIAVREFWPECDASYYLDIWSDSPDADEILAIRKILIELLDELLFSTDEVDRAKFTLQTDAFIPEIEEGIWHYALMFNLRYFRYAEITAIDAR